MPKSWFDQELERDPSLAITLEEETLVESAFDALDREIENQKISKSALAKRLGTSKAYVTQLLNGKRNLTLRTLARVAYALGFRIEPIRLQPLHVQHTSILRGYRLSNGDEGNMAKAKLKRRQVRTVPPAARR